MKPTLAFTIGAFFWADSASVAGSNTAPPSSGRALINSSDPSTAAPIPTPQYHLATGPQVLLGPSIGLQFGP